MGSTSAMIDKSISNKYYIWAIIFFGISIWYAVLVDLPAGLANFFVSKNDVNTIPANFSPTIIALLEQLYALLQMADYSGGIPWHKMGKDFLLLVSLFFAGIGIFKGGNLKKYVTVKSPIWISYLSLLVIISILGVISFVRDGYWPVLIGLRAHIALAAFVVGLNLLPDDLRKLWNWVKLLLLIELLLSLAQRWFQIQNQVWDFQERSRGSFHEVNSFGLFLAVSLVYSLIFSQSKFDRWGFSSMIFVMIALTRSRTAILLSVIIIGIYLWTRIRSAKLKGIFVGILVLALPFSPLLLGWLSGRPEVVQNFLALRGTGPVAYLLSASPLDTFFGMGLGRGTTLMINLETVTGLTPDASYDNLIGSALVQGGVLLLILSIAYLASPVIRSRSRFVPLVVTALSLASAVAIPYWEVWPVNIMVMLIYGYLAGVQLREEYATHTDIISI